jgi:hypothetical protein
MGDYFQTLADVDATLEEAEAIATRIRDWLVDSRIIEPEPQNCVLGMNNTGYPPLNYEQVIDELPGSGYDLHQLKNNGLEIELGRRVFHNGQSGVTITCPKCGAPCGDKWAEAISEWYENTGAGMLRCFQCGQERSITEWSFDPPWGFGNLGFTFWNWPPLKESFIDEMKKRIAHRTVFIADKL